MDVRGYLSIAVIVACHAAVARPAAAQGDAPIHVCVGADRLLRQVPLRQRCPAGDKNLYLSRAEPQFELLKTAPDAAARPPRPQPSAQERVASIDRRVRALDRRPASRATAPFDVVDATGQPVLTVEPDFLRLFHAGRQQAQIAVSEHGANVLLGDRVRTHLYTFASQAGFTVDGGGKERIDLGIGEAGNGRLLFHTATGQTLAGIGQSAQGTGAVRVGSSTSTLKAAMQIGVQGDGVVMVANDAGTPLGALTQGENPAGLFQVGDARGETVVKAGASTGGRYGVVLAGPAAIFPANGLGLPGSFLLGSAGK